MTTLISMFVLLFAQIIYLPIVITNGGTVTGEASTPVNPSVTVLPNTATSYDNASGYVIYGEVQNNLAVPVSLVRVFATKPNGEQRDELAQRGYLNPGEKGCFALRIQSSTPWDDATLTVTYLDLPSATRASNFAVEEVQSGQDNGYPVISGTARNNNENAVRSAYVVATLYDDAGNVVGCNAVSLVPRDLPTGAVGSFYTRFAAYAQRPVAGYALVFDGVMRR